MSPFFRKIFSAITHGTFSPLPGGIPAKFRNIWFSLTQTSRLRNETIYLGKSLNLSRESKPNQSRSTQKEDINVHLPKIKKNNTIDKQTRPIQTNIQTKISVHNVSQAKTGLQPINKLALFSLKQINTLYSNPRPSQKGRGEREGEGEVRDPFFIYSMP